jgi:anti-sigma regulatory factor (Ser/Thr protein kinase)
MSEEDGIELTETLRCVLQTGESQRVIEARAGAGGEPDADAACAEARVWLTSYYPIRDERRGGEIVAIGAVAVEITERKQVEAEREQLVQELTEATERQRRFLREMLAGVTGGRLLLCDTDADLPEPYVPVCDRVPLSVSSLRFVRRDVMTTAVERGFEPARWQDLETAVGEAAMNAVVHAGGGVAWVCAAADGAAIQVWVCDHGPGIAEERLHRATLERGYTTAGTLGHGFWMMIQTADRTYLRTGAEGTTVVMEQSRVAPKPVWFQGL